MIKESFQALQIQLQNKDCRLFNGFIEDSFGGVQAEGDRGQLGW
jgi:hypothetical protein